MSQRLVARSADLKRLRDEGYDIKVAGTHLLVRDVPYVTSDKEVKRGTLVTPLDLHQDVTIKPKSHVAYFIGEFPCSLNGDRLTKVVIGNEKVALADGVVADLTLSSRPTHGRGYANYHEKVATYVKMISNEARALDSTVTAKTFPVVLDENDDSPFRFLDTASSRAGIGAHSSKLAQENIAIIGLGGTGAYVLDLVAKTHARQIHMYDDDDFGQHTAFRAPGALGIDDLKPGMKKVDYYRGVYSAMRNGLVPHPYRVDESNARELATMQFVFLCIDSGEEKDSITKALEETGVPFIDVGMGVHDKGGALTGILRVTTSTPAKRDHVRDNHRVSFAPPSPNNEYASDIQVADLNALNAALAVVTWKKLRGFYHDLTKERHSTYVIETHKLSKEDREE